METETNLMVPHIDVESIPPRPFKIEPFTGEDGQHRWRMRAANGEIVGDCGEGYEKAVERDAAMQRIVEAGKRGFVIVW